MQSGDRIELNLEVHKMQKLNIPTDTAPRVDEKKGGYWSIYCV